MNWRGRPLRTFETVVNLISETTNRAGLFVRARLDRRAFPIGKKVSAKEFRSLKIERDDVTIRQSASSGDISRAA